MNNIIRIYITENCNSKCNNCFNAKERGNSTIDKSSFTELCQYFKSHGIKTIKIMGGEPTIHPQFFEIMKIAQTYFYEVYLFTNAINNKILEFNPRETDAIIYNFRFSKTLTKEKLLLNKPGRRSLEIQITKTTNIKKIYDEIILKCGEYTDRINPCLTFDCTENIFENRASLIEKHQSIWDLCSNYGFKMSQDHLVPLCFIYGSKIKMPQSGCICQDNCAGLIDANFNIKFCNQYSKKLGNLFENNSLIPYDKYLEIISNERKSIQNLVKNKICDKCPFYKSYCNGGCFMGKDIIDVKSVMNNSQIFQYFT